MTRPETLESRQSDFEATYRREKATPRESEAWLYKNDDLKLAAPTN